MRGILALTILVVALGIGGTNDVREAVDHGSTYCQMVQLHETSDGLLGWPPYDSRINCGN